MPIWAADVCSWAARQLICIVPTGLRLRHIGKTDPQCDTVQFCFHSGRLTCSARIGFRAVTTSMSSSACQPVLGFIRTHSDSQSQKLDGTKIHLVPTLSEVGGDASDGSRRVVAPIVIAVL